MNTAQRPMKEMLMIDELGQEHPGIIDLGGRIEVDMYLTYREEWQAMETHFALLSIETTPPTNWGDQIDLPGRISALSVNRAGVIESRIQILLSPQSWPNGNATLQSAEAENHTLINSLIALNTFLGDQTVFIWDEIAQKTTIERLFEQAGTQPPKGLLGIKAAAEMSALSSLPGSATGAHLAQLLSRQDMPVEGLDGLQYHLALLLAAREDTEHFHQQRIARAACSPENGHILDRANGVVFCRFCQNYHSFP